MQSPMHSGNFLVEEEKNLNIDCAFLPMHSMGAIFVLTRAVEMWYLTLLEVCCLFS